MRIGQLPSVRELTPDITPLIQARQMKDQAYQNIAGTVAQLSAQKEQKTLEKKQKKQAIDDLTPIIDSLKARDPSLDIDAKDMVGSLGAQEAMNQAQTFLRTLITERNEKAKVAAGLAEAQASMAQTKSDSATDALSAAIEYEFGSKANYVGSEEVLSFAANLVKQDPDKFSAARIGESVEEGLSRGIKKLEAFGTREEKREAVLKADIDTTGSQIERRNMIFNAATRAYDMLESLTDEDKAKFNELNSELNQFLANQNLTNAKDLSNDQFTSFLQQMAQRVGEYAPGTKASTFAQAIQSLSGQIANMTLQGTRALSRDGSSGYGQLTAPELTLLKNFYGALVTESGFMADFANVRNTLRLVISDMPSKSVAARDNMYEKVLRRRDLGITEKDIDKRFKRSLGGKDPSKYRLFFFNPDKYFGGERSLPEAPDLFSRGLSEQVALGRIRQPTPQQSGIAAGGSPFQTFIDADGNQRTIIPELNTLGN